MDSAKADIKYLPGVGAKRAALLAKELEIYTIDDLLRYVPYKYIDRSRFYKIREIDSTSAYIQLRGYITHFEVKGEGRKARLIATFSDGIDTLDLIFFRGGRYVTDAYKLRQEYVVFGKPALFNGRYNLVHPDIELPSPDRMQGFMPLYRTTEKMKTAFLHSKALQKLVYLALKQCAGKLEETLPSDLLQQHHFMGLYQALVQVHFPKDMEVLDAARRRLKFEELFYIQLVILKQAGLYKSKAHGHPFSVVGKYFNDFYQHCLPFELTQAQKRVMREIRADLKGPAQMNRLLQGDVGSGKTVVALLSMLLAVDNGYQACLLAPTEILATQHYADLKQLLTPLGLEIRLLTGSTKKKEREEIHRGLTSGTLPLLVGTHAVLEETVLFRQLGLAVIDEQHRFGVAQRARMWAKNLRPPHILVMTATPIPRTLAMTLYGDLEVSVIDELPPGRKAVKTYCMYLEKSGKMLQFLHRQLAEGRQVYVVYPLIQESEKMDLQNLESGFEQMKAWFPACEVGMLHGKMKPAEKEAAMRAFVRGQTRILVATTVIEVGVNVPNASVMVIQNAERFGLAQLHQLRGRVGRGAEQSYCILLSHYEISSDTRKRLEIMCETNNGFELAEADLKFRGPGEMDGTLQSGLPFTLRIADLAKDGDLLQQAREAAVLILQQDPLLSSPENSILARQLRCRAKDVVHWSAIS